LKIGILTSGGDCAGMNAVIRAFTLRAIHEFGWRVVGFLDGFAGLIDKQFITLDEKQVFKIASQGGTILGTSNNVDPFEYYLPNSTSPIDVSDRVLAYIKELHIDALVTIGGDGTQHMAYRLFKLGVPVIGIPKTIDNDLGGTDQTFGFDTAVSIATEAIDRIQTTAESHHRIMLVEVMGRYAGWIALYSGLASGADIILIPEIPFSLERIKDQIDARVRDGHKYTLIVVSEGAREEGKDYSIMKMVKNSHDPIRLGGAAAQLGQRLEEETGIEARATVLGHLLRGGVPVSSDRILSTRYGAGAVDLVADKKFGHMVALRQGKIASATLEEATMALRLVTPDHELVARAKQVGIIFG